MSDGFELSVHCQGHKTSLGSFLQSRQAVQLLKGIAELGFDSVGTTRAIASQQTIPLVRESFAINTANAGQHTRLNRTPFMLEAGVLDISQSG